jgi:hypothetical protein
MQKSSLGLPQSLPLASGKSRYPHHVPASLLGGSRWSDTSGERRKRIAVGHQSR